MEEAGFKTTKIIQKRLWGLPVAAVAARKHDKFIR